MPFTPQKWAESLNFRRWEDFTTDTNDGQLEQSLLFNNICTDPAAVILCPGSRYGGSFTTLRFDKVLSETEEFVPSRVLLTLFQRDRIFGRDNSSPEVFCAPENNAAFFRITGGEQVMVRREVGTTIDPAQCATRPSLAA